MAYDRFYIQKEDKNSTIKESIADFGIYVKDVPFAIFPEMKELPTNDWYDEDGEEVYTPQGDERMRMAAYDLTIEFAYKGDEDTAKSAVRDFLDYITGRSDGLILMRMYDTHTRIGRKNVRVKSVSDDATYKRSNGGEVLLFKVTFRVGDPVTDIKLVEDNGVYNLQ